VEQRIFLPTSSGSRAVTENTTARLSVLPLVVMLAAYLQHPSHATFGYEGDGWVNGFGHFGLRRQSVGERNRCYRLFGRGAGGKDLVFVKYCINVSTPYP
jgi:hypothetical protein